jgi:4-amino-4-deoxy-L-arabinose transferase-like glycosyltransferase
MQIHYAGKISKNEFLQAIFLNSPRLKFQRWFFAIVLFFVAFSLVYLWVMSPGSVDTEWFPGLLIFFIFATFPWWVPYIQLASFDQKTNIYRNNVFGTIDDTGISINSAEIKTSFQWSVFIDYKLSKDLCMLYQSRNCFNLFKPDMFGTREEWDKFVSFAADKISANKKRT